MILRSVIKSSIFLTCIFVISIFLLFFIASLSFRQINNLSDSQALVANSQEIHLTLEQVLSLMKDAETGQRGFMLTGDSTFLEPYIFADSTVYSKFAHLSKLIAEHSEQEQNLDTLLSLIVNKLTIISSNIHDDRQPGNSNEVEIQRLEKGKEAMNRLRKHISKMVAVEENRLKIRQEAYEHEAFFSPLASLLVVLFALVVFTFSFYKINLDSKKFRDLNAQLMDQNEQFNYAEEISKMGSYTWDLASGQVEYSDNLYRIMGYQPGAVIPDKAERFYNIHPDDEERVQKMISDTIAKKTSFNTSWRMKTTTGYTPVQGTGRFVQQNSSSSLIGNIQDITELHSSKLQLEQKNRELESSNKDLASFNHVASHDLQEPLRKIQTFISRIEENEMEGMTGNAIEYFERIRSSANRMQTLINDLLAFSRTNKSDQPFQATDLNEVLEKAKNDLVQNIEDKHAVINAATLPIINCIPYQMEQLFINLIGNSLKYSRTNVIPEITITTSKISGAELKFEKVDKLVTYQKIVVADNGIGFEPQYAETIFILFQRLHDKLSYSGTGIGLALCKKITENHKGFITAHGTPNVGSTFEIYLPA